MLASVWRSAAALSTGVALVTCVASAAKAQSTVAVPPITSWSLVKSAAASVSTIPSGHTAIVTVLADGNNDRDACLELDNVKLEPNRDYEMIFRARGNAQFGGVAVLVNSVTGSGDASDRSVSMQTQLQFGDTTNWFIHDRTFSVVGSGPMRIRLFIPLNKGTTQISDVWIGTPGTAPAYLLQAPTATSGDAADASSSTGTSAASQIASDKSLSGAWTLQTSGIAQAGVIHSQGGLIIDVDRVGNSVSDVAYGTNGSQLSTGGDYVLHFRARASQARAVQAAIGSQGSQPDLLSHSVSVGTEWADYNLPFKNSSGSSAFWAAILLGDHTGTFEISDARIEDAKALDQTASASHSITVAPGSPAPIAQWDLDTSGDAVADLLATAGGATVEVDRSDGVLDHVMLKQDGLNFGSGMYELQFKAKASVSHDVRIVAVVDGGGTGTDFRDLGLTANVHLTPTWHDYDVKFTPTQAVDLHARIAFYLGARAGTVDFSDVILGPANPAAQTADASDPGAASPPIRLALRL